MLYTKINFNMLYTHFTIYTIDVHPRIHMLFVICFLFASGTNSVGMCGNKQLF